MEVTKRGRGGKFDTSADPTELTIQLEASAIRLTWSPEEECRRRVQRCDYTPPDAEPVNVRSLCGVPRGT